MTRPLGLFVTMLMMLALGDSALAEDRPSVPVTRVTDAIRLDGRLSETDWERATPITRFQLIDVREGETPAESTEVRVLASASHVYFGIHCANRTPGPIRASLSPRDQILDDDHISVHLDTYRDLHRAYIFGVNPYGVQLDGILDGGSPDFSWDAGWDAEATRDSGGWTAEIAIPLRVLRFPSGGGTWGLWFRRKITKHDEVCSWPLYRAAVAGDIMLQAGDLTGLEELRGGGRVEIQPYAANTTTAARAPLPQGGMSSWGSETTGAVGLDVRYGLTSTLTANLTLNPDYSQVEADAVQIVVNQRFPLYFPEKRPFFLEGAETYSTPFQLVYTRRIADPAYGGKLTGKLGRWRLGAITVRDDGGGSTEGIGAYADGSEAPPGYFNIGRATYDIGESSNIGVMLTDHRTDAPDSGAATAAYPGRSSNTVASLDAKFRLAPSLFVNGQFAHSASRIDTVSGNSGAPFSDHLAEGAVLWEDGIRRAYLYQDYVGADFRADAGFLSRIDYRETGYVAHVIVRPENRWLRSWKPTSNGDIIRDTRGELEERRLAGAIEWVFQKQTWAETRVAHVDERWHSTLYDRWRYIGSVGNSLWRPLSLQFDAVLEDGIFYGDADSTSYLGWQEYYALGATLRPSPRLTAELSTTRSRFSRERGGEEVYDIWLVGAKATYQFTRRLYMRLYPQYDSDAEHLAIDGLLGYVIYPGSVVYLGLNSGFDRIDNRQRATAGTLFFKLSYVFRG